MKYTTYTEFKVTFTSVKIEVSETGKSFRLTIEESERTKYGITMPATIYTKNSRSLSKLESDKRFKRLLDFKMQLETINS